MAMDFFENQDVARRKTGRLILLFILAVLAIILTVFLLVGAVLGYLAQEELARNGLHWYHFMNGELLLAIAIGVLLIVGGGTLVKIAQLRGGGRVIAESLGGRLIHSDTNRSLERKVLNVVEEMAIASGTPAPPVYLLDHEQGINAFAAGFSPSDAVIGVTRGCVDQLSRDELQGVVAHEFSHILNGDMRINIRLIGVLHGILIIGILGYFILRSAFYSGGYASRSRRSNPLPLLALGGGLLVIGSMGTFFGKLIKAAVSRQREYLADASAVQFTRNPNGIAGALKRIGGFVNGSTIESPNAPEASHMFFSEAVSNFLGAMLATHPPLAKRIHRLDPQWQTDGPAEVKDVGQPETSTLLTPSTSQLMGVQSLASTSGAQVSQAIQSAVNQIGQPTELHIHYASQLVNSLPLSIKTAAHEPYGSRALMYALLIDRDQKSRSLQIEQLSQHADKDVFKETMRLLPTVEQLPPMFRLPVIDMAIPALRELTAVQYRVFHNNVRFLVMADQAIQLFEWVLQRILLHHVESHFVSFRPSRVIYRGLDKLTGHCQTVLSILAYSGHDDDQQAQMAYQQAAEALNLPRLNMDKKELCNIDNLDMALEVLVGLAPRLKRQLIRACAVCISADKHVSVEEAELLRAISDTLDCPMPPLLAGQPVSNPS